MPPTGLEIYKLLPQTNCKECGLPTCLAFAMKLAAKQSELKACPYVSEESKVKLEAASAPPIRLVQMPGDGTKLERGNETVLFRHAKTLLPRPGLFLRLKDTDGPEVLKTKATEADAYKADYVGISLGLDGFALEAASGDPARSKPAGAAVAGVSLKPLILIATSETWQAMAEIAK